MKLNSFLNSLMITKGQEILIFANGNVILSGEILPNQIKLNNDYIVNRFHYNDSIKTYIIYC